MIGCQRHQGHSTIDTPRESNGRWPFDPKAGVARCRSRSVTYRLGTFSRYGSLLALGSLGAVHCAGGGLRLVPACHRLRSRRASSIRSLARRELRSVKRCSAPRSAARVDILPERIGVMADFLMVLSDESLELLEAIADEMVRQFGVSRAEAVARINEHWNTADLSGDDEIILHEDEYYWALWIYFGGQVADWRPDADRSVWKPRPASSRDSGMWTSDEGSGPSSGGFE